MIHTIPENDSQSLKSLNLLNKKCRFTIKSIKKQCESQEYEGLSYTVNDKTVLFRTAKITPKKLGQFVTIWKRMNSKSVPYDLNDNIDLLVVNFLNHKRVGQFIFNKSLLVNKKIFSKNNIGGKRAMRIYSPWDKLYSKQAIQNQNWQIKYFIEISSEQSINIESIKHLYGV